MKFRLRQLEAFQAVARSGSMTRAAKTLGVSQPAVSRLLSDFSQAVSVDLFTRSEGVLVPTSEARYLLSEVNRVLDSLKHLEDLNRDLSERTAGHLRIACLPGFATMHLPHLLADFLDQRPGVRLTLEPDRPERILDWIISHQYDCGLTDEFASHPAVETTDVPIRTVCVVPRNSDLAERDVITPTDLRDRKLIHTRRDSPFFKRLTRAFSEYGVEMNSWVEVRQFATACIMVNKGHGVTIVSALDAEAFRHQDVEIRPFEPAVEHRLTVLRPMSGNRSLLALDFLDMFMDSLAPFRVGSPSSRY
ncbi:LysR substrate-binding domain-containing protein [Phaeobacter sp.]|uniref:LysR substrate-binding domain-containing protein n=1 Tax=Phaeobacter sp. TaxID=1902409 RepID=UPI0025DA6E91|nr:LysR substrate-binding domain-containing protein [Phaeobacter sp.]